MTQSWTHRSGPSNTNCSFTLTLKITHRPATSFPPSQSSRSEAEPNPLKQRNPLSDQRPLGTKAHFSLESCSFYNGARHSSRPQERPIPYFTSPQTSIAEQNRPSMPNRCLSYAQHRKSLKSKSISQHCENLGDKTSTESLWRGTLPGGEMHFYQIYWTLMETCVFINTTTEWFPDLEWFKCKTVEGTDKREVRAENK